MITKNKITAVFFFVLMLLNFNWLQAQNIKQKTESKQIKAANDSIGDETIAVAYGKRTKSTLTASVSTINSDKLKKSPVSTIGNAIQGLASGLTILRTVGAEPGWDQPNIYIRGIQTFGGGNAPLVMVDDVERDFTQLDPEEIESISILKDAAALAMYGMRAANGVIRVVTKKGFVGKPEVTLTLQYGMQQPTRLPQYASAPDFVRYRNLGLRNDYNKLTDSEFNSLFLSNPRNNPDNYNGSNPVLYANTNWYDTFLSKQAPQQMHKLSFRGGSETARYYLMIGLVDQQGLYNFSNESAGFTTQNVFSRYNFRSAIDVDLTSDLTVGVNLAGRVENRHTPNSSAASIISSLSKLPPTMPVRNADNSLAGTAEFRNNSYGLIAKTGFADRFSRVLQGTATADLKLNKLLQGLSANALFGFDATRDYGRSKSQSFAVFQQNLDGTYTKFGEDTPTDIYYSGWGSAFSLMLNYQAGLAYSRLFGAHAIDADVKYMQSTYATDGNNPEYKNQGVFGRSTYTFDKRYTAEFGFAYNGSENFIKGSRFGFFPTISAAWTASNEDFLRDNETISFMKLRGSFGKVGNSNIGVGYRYPYEQNFYAGSGYYFGTSDTDGSYEGRIPNPYITWEESMNANIGFEMDLFRKLSIEADLFSNNRSQIITGRWNTLPSFIGQDLPYENSGSVLSQGFEISMKFADKLNAFGYFVQGNFSFVKNKITAQQEVQGMNAWEYRTNRAVMQQWGLEVSPDKFFATQAEIDAWAKSTYGTVQPGDVKYVDQNNDGVIDGQDYIPMGNPSVPEAVYGFNLGCDYKGLDFNILLSGMLNRSLFISNNVLWGLQDNNNITADVAENSWGVSQTPQYPRLTTQANPHNYQASSLWLRNVDFLRIQNMEIGYSLPAKWLRKVSISSLRFFVNGYNLISFDGLKKLHLNAEVPNAGVTLYPETRVINIGTSLKF